TQSAAVPERVAPLEVQGLRKAFGGLVAVDDLSFTIARGELVGLIGPNGSGKTTVLHTLSGARPADAPPGPRHDPLQGARSRANARLPHRAPRARAHLPAGARARIDDGNRERDA